MKLLTPTFPGKLFPLLFLFFFSHSLSAQEDLGLDVVRIETTDQNGLPKVGSGFVAGIQNGNIFIVSAFHVVKGASSITVKFKKIPWEPAYARIVIAAEEQDLVVLSARLPNLDLSLLNILIQILHQIQEFLLERKLIHYHLVNQINHKLQEALQFLPDLPLTMQLED